MILVSLWIAGLGGGLFMHSTLGPDRSGWGAGRHIHCFNRSPLFNDCRLVRWCVCGGGGGQVISHGGSCKEGPHRSNEVMTGLSRDPEISSLRSDNTTDIHSESSIGSPSLDTNLTSTRALTVIVLGSNAGPSIVTPWSVWEEECDDV